MMLWQGTWDPAQDSLPADFLDLPAQIYAEDPYWLGEDSASVQQAFSVANTWFEQGHAWVGLIPHQARLAGFILPGQLIQGEQAAFFGYWETMNVPEANATLFNALKTWAEAKGAKKIYGPINFTTYGAYRVRLDAFEAGAFPGEPWNPPYYAELMQSLGLTSCYRYLSTFTSVEDTVVNVRKDLERVNKRMQGKVRLLPMLPEDWLRDLDQLYDFVQQSFADNFAYTPLSLKAFRNHCGHPFADRFCPLTSLRAETSDGAIAGFFLAYPDYSPLLRVHGTRPISLSALHYDRHRSELPHPRRLLARTAAVHPDYRDMGLFTAMSCELTLRAQGHYEQIAAALVREDNASAHFAQRHGTTRMHHYALYCGNLRT
ncbi:MAG: hypothetical protein HKM02_08505 [Pseudomonadales bacterium]|nr:hypothetical protein [Pseudomonadales bacterium]